MKDKSHRKDNIMAVLFMLFMILVASYRYWPVFYYERYVYPHRVTDKMKRSLSERGALRYAFAHGERVMTPIPFDRRIVHGDDANFLTYQSDEEYSVLTFVEHKFFISFMLLETYGFEQIQFQNTKGIIDTVYFVPED